MLSLGAPKNTTLNNALDKIDGHAPLAVNEVWCVANRVRGQHVLGQKNKLPTTKNGTDTRNAKENLKRSNYTTSPFPLLP